MVYVCSITNYPKEREQKYNEYFEKFQYPLHIFQKWAIEGIVEGQHVLVTAPTGSGKSLPAEFCVDYFVKNKKKKVIYCSPIKSLSNQKFYDFSQKYPDISIGIITGDIKNNSNADVLIMTTEILLNKLYQIKSKDDRTGTNYSAVSFEMDLEKELGVVIFDEIHMINDTSRGHVWEQSIMLLPKHIQMVGLSATLDNPEKFAYWLENRVENDSSIKKEPDDKPIVYLSSKKERTVPLTHYSFITTTQGIFKSIKDKSVHEEIKALTNTPYIIQDAKGKFQEEHYFKMTKMLKLFEDKDVRIKRPHVLNQCLKYLTEHEMTPAICYVFSIKKLEVCAREVTTNLLEFDSKVPYTIRRECEQILRKLPNFEEYLHIPEYIHLVALLEKGIAVHHSKMLPILREIVEILFARGCIKVLFATESVAIGLNLPVKTTIFTDINKFDGEHLRFLHAHEYTQAAGRAGRLGLDTVGHVIHLNNLFRNVDSVSYKAMMNGKPQVLQSKFKISYHLLLSLIDIGENGFVAFSKRSMVKGDLDGELKEVYDEIAHIAGELEVTETQHLKHLRTPSNVIEEYIDLMEKRPTAVNKKRKEIERRIQDIQDSYRSVESDKETMKKYHDKQCLLYQLEAKYKSMEKYIDQNVESILCILREKVFILSNPQVTFMSSLTLKGTIASCLKEVPCLLFAEWFIDSNNKNVSINIFELQAKQLIVLLSCFTTNINVSDDYKDWTPNKRTSDSNVITFLEEEVQPRIKEYKEREEKARVDTGTDYSIHYDLMKYVEEWSNADCVEECKIVLQKLEREKEIFLGEFVKAILKINTIVSELERVAELLGNIEFLSRLREIPGLTMKYVVTNQSLYI